MRIIELSTPKNVCPRSLADNRCVVRQTKHIFGFGGVPIDRLTPKSAVGAELLGRTEHFRFVLKSIISVRRLSVIRECGSVSSVN